MANSGEAVRRGDFYAAGTPRPAADETPEDAAEPQEPAAGDEDADAAE